MSLFISISVMELCELHIHPSWVPWKLPLATALAGCVGEADDPGSTCLLSSVFLYFSGFLPIILPSDLILTFAFSRLSVLKVLTGIRIESDPTACTAHQDVHTFLLFVISQGRKPCAVTESDSGKVLLTGKVCSSWKKATDTKERGLKDGSCG